jgi:hypothetical protein
MAITSRALAFASRWFDTQTVARVFDPLVADWQREWIDAPRSQRPVVHLKGLLGFCIAIIVSTPVMLQMRAPQRLTDRIARRIAIGAAIGTLALMLPFVREIGSLPQRGLLILSLIPQALTLAFPFALVPAVDAIRDFNGLDAPARRAAVSKLAVFAVAFVFFFHGWVMPAANQVYRETALEASVRAQGNANAIAQFGRSRGPVPGVREMSNSELLASLVRAANGEPGRNPHATATSLQIEINNRAAVAILPVLLLWRRWRALDLPAGRWFSARHSAIATVAMIVAFGVMTPLSHSFAHAWRMPVGIGSWLTLVFLAAIGSLRVWIVERSVARA